jgi:uncharacterized membrane protein
MKKLRAFVATTTIGGITVVLPTVLLIMIFRGLFRWASGLIRPLTGMLAARAPLQGVLADLVVLSLILLVCFLVGLIVRTKMGRFLQQNLEKHILDVAPGYRIIRETVMQLLGRKKSPFSTVALVRLYNNEALMTAFVTDDHEGDWYSIFIPTGPNPTTGYIVHLPGERVFPIDVRVDTAIRSVIACGAGSGPLLDRWRSMHPQGVKTPLAPADP